jgi:uncharacterized protein YndB with AHSA1/START domain
MKKDETPIVVEETFSLSIDSVWNAITEVDQMRRWFFMNIPDFKPVPGFKIEFNVDNGGKRFLHRWRITRAIPKKLIEYNWKYGGYTGDSYVAFELEQIDGSTRLRLTHTITEDFPDEIPEFQRESCVGGWKYFINQNLKKYLGTHQ